jgi:ligand-binding sensor domain-containing protein
MQKGLGQTESRNTTKAPSLWADIPFDFENAIHRVYGAEHGLPSNWVQAVLQTSDGFLWLGTHNGLARFDGVNFVSYQRPRLPANDCRELLESRDGTLWIGTTGGLAKYRRGCPGSFEQIEELAQQSIRVIFEDSSGRIWVGTNRKTWRSNGLTFEPIDEAPNAVSSIIEDGLNIWLGSEYGLYEDSGLYRNIPLADNVPQATKITQLLLDDGELLIGTDRGVMQIENDRVQFLRPKFGDEYINHIQKIGADSFVLGRQVYRRNNDVYEVVNHIHRDLSPAIATEGCGSAGYETGNFTTINRNHLPRYSLASQCEQSTKTTARSG